MKFTADRYKIMNTVRNHLNYLYVLMGCELALTSGLGWTHNPTAVRKEKCCKQGEGKSRSEISLQSYCSHEQSSCKIEIVTSGPV